VTKPEKDPDSVSAPGRVVVSPGNCCWLVFTVVFVYFSTDACGTTFGASTYNLAVSADCYEAYASWRELSAAYCSAAAFAKSADSASLAAAASLAILSAELLDASA